MDEELIQYIKNAELYYQELNETCKELEALSRKALRIIRDPIACIMRAEEMPEINVKMQLKLIAFSQLSNTLVEAQMMLGENSKEDEE